VPAWRDHIVGMAAPLFQLDGLTLTRSGRIVLDSLCASIPEGSSAVAGPPDAASRRSCAS
jgi:hypothetical protein